MAKIDAITPLRAFTMSFYISRHALAPVQENLCMYKDKEREGDSVAPMSLILFSLSLQTSIHVYTCNIRVASLIITDIRRIFTMNIIHHPLVNVSDWLSSG